MPKEIVNKILPVTVRAAANYEKDLFLQILGAKDFAK